MLDYEALPPRTAAALFYGLRDDARIKMQLAGVETSVDRLLLALVADRLGLLVWAKTEDVKYGRNRPQSFAERLAGAAKDESDVRSFADGAAFEAARAKIVKEAEQWQT